MIKAHELIFAEKPKFRVDYFEDRQVACFSVDPPQRPNRELKFDVQSYIFELQVDSDTVVLGTCDVFHTSGVLVKSFPLPLQSRCVKGSLRVVAVYKDGEKQPSEAVEVKRLPMKSKFSKIILHAVLPSEFARRPR